MPTIDPTKVLSGTTYLGVAGNIPLGNSISGINGSTTFNISDGYYSSKTVTANDTNLTATNIATGVTIFGVPGSAIVSLGNAGAGDVLAGKTFSTSTAANVSGTISVKSGEVASVASATSSTKLLLTAPIGYYDGTVTLSTTSVNFTASNIKSGINIFGIIGSMLAGYTYGDSDPSKVLTTATGAGTYLATDYSLQKLQTKDDWVDSGGTVDEYTAEENAWPAVTGSPFAGNTAINYAGSGGDLDLYSGAVLQDSRTGLWWSDTSAVGASASSTTNVFTLTADGSRPTGGNAIGFCDALNAYNSGVGFGGHNDWYLPTQKQLMQAYIDGAANHLPNPGNYFWSSTEYYNSTTYAWNVYLANGNPNYTNKATNYTVRCVRS